MKFSSMNQKRQTDRYELTMYILNTDTGLYYRVDINTEINILYFTDIKSV